MLSHRSLILLSFFFFHLAFWMVFWLESKIWHKWTFYKTKQIPRHRTDLRLWGGGRGREELARLGLEDANCYIRDGWTMRHRELCSVSCDDPQWKRTCICITESPCRTAEINHNIVNQPYLNMRGTKRIKFVHSFLTKKRPLHSYLMQRQFAVFLVALWTLPSMPEPPVLVLYIRVPTGPEF